MESEALCFLCVEARISPATPTPWTDQLLRYEPGVGSLIAGVGAQRVGYCLLSPTEHIVSICALSSDQIRTFEGFVKLQLDTLTGRYGPLTYWEHGGVSDGQRTSACVDHAHLHVLPGIVPLQIESRGLVRYRHIGEWLRDARRWRGLPYVAFGHSNDACLVGPDPRVPQYFRRQVARFTDQRDECDYAASPNYGLVRQTIDEVLRLPS